MLNRERKEWRDQETLNVHGVVNSHWALNGLWSWRPFWSQETQLETIAAHQAKGQTTALAKSAYSRVPSQEPVCIVDCRPFICQFSLFKHPLWSMYSYYRKGQDQWLPGASGWWWEAWLQRGVEEFGRWQRTGLYHDCGDSFMSVYTGQNSQNYMLKSMNFIACKLYLNEKIQRSTIYPPPQIIVHLF